MLLPLNEVQGDMRKSIHYLIRLTALIRHEDYHISG